MTFRPIDLSGFTPAPLRDQPAPSVQWVAIADLVIDDRYQRQITPSGRRHIQRVAEAFDWKAFGAISVAATPGGKFAVVDGQHRAHAAALVGLDMVPCIAVPMTTAEQASAFHQVNAARIRLDRAATFRAQLAAGEPLAVRAEAAVRAAGCVLMQTIPSASQRKPREVYTHRLIERMVADGLDEVVTIGLKAIADSEAGQEHWVAQHGHGFRVWDQVVLAIWLPMLASNAQFLRLPLAEVFDSIHWQEWVEQAREAQRNDPRGPSARARVAGRVEGVLRDAHRNRLADAYSEPFKRLARA